MINNMIFSLEIGDSEQIRKDLEIINVDEPMKKDFIHFVLNYVDSFEFDELIQILNTNK